MRIRKDVEVGRPLAEVFDYVADFSNAAEWDPGVVEARKLTDGPVRVGSEFDVVALFRGNRHRFHYVVTGLEPQRRVVLSGEGDRAASVDEIVLEPAGDGTRITYIADFHLKGIFRPAGPLLVPVMSRMGDDALAGLKSVLDG
ncbi:MAG TPA: SRPBCC family protein [Gaiellaceae bacterium]|nr:SRPBCC family protein [Gaiellaceae bacterium]